jgi:hypothetical protein
MEHDLIMPDLLETDKDAHISRETKVKCQCLEEVVQATEPALNRRDLEHEGRGAKLPAEESSSSAISAGGPEIIPDVGIVDVPQFMQQLGKEADEQLMEQTDQEAVAQCLKELEEEGVAMKPHQLGPAADRTRVSTMEQLLVLQADRRELLGHTAKLKSTRCKPPWWLTKVKMRPNF